MASLSAIGGPESERQRWQMEMLGARATPYMTPGRAYHVTPGGALPGARRTVQAQLLAGTQPMFVSVYPAAPEAPGGGAPGGAPEGYAATGGRGGRASSAPGTPPPGASVGSTCSLRLVRCRSPSRLDALPGVLTASGCH